MSSQNHSHEARRSRSDVAKILKQMKKEEDKAAQRAKDILEGEIDAYFAAVNFGQEDYGGSLRLSRKLSNKFRGESFSYEFGKNRHAICAWYGGERPYLVLMEDVNVKSVGICGLVSIVGERNGLLGAMCGISGIIEVPLTKGIKMPESEKVNHIGLYRRLLADYLTKNKK